MSIKLYPRGTHYELPETGVTCPGFDHGFDREELAVGTIVDTLEDGSWGAKLGCTTTFCFRDCFNHEFCNADRVKDRVQDHIQTFFRERIQGRLRNVASYYLGEETAKKLDSYGETALKKFQDVVLD